MSIPTALRSVFSSSGAGERRARFAAMFALVAAGEAIFSLPFHVPRYFRPSVLGAFGFSNAELGDVFAVYGVMAMVAYFPGGLLADRFSARKLMALSLAATAAGGLYMATLPGTRGMSALYGYWGVTTILLFWAPMIRATRRWGGEPAQGRAFGILDGGRGLVAAVLAGIAVAYFGQFVAAGAHELGDLERRAAVRAVILFYSLVTLVAAGLVALFVPNESADLNSGNDPFDRHELRAVLRLRVVWLQALVVVCAYCGYKGLDTYSLYAFEVLGMDEAGAARFTAVSAYLRPIGAVLAGLLADRRGIAPVIAGLFAALAAVYALLSFLTPGSGLDVLIYANLLVSMFCVFALRGVYFALLEETRVPHALTGAAVGLISLVGYTPDVFFAPLAGRILDAAPGIDGHHDYFALLTGIAVLGAVVTALLMRATRVESSSAQLLRR